MNEFQKVLEKYHMEKWFRKENLIVMILIGILLIVIALPTKENKDAEEKDDLVQREESWMQLENENRSGTNAENSVISSNEDCSVGAEFKNTVEYIETLEKKLEEILSHIQGIGEVYVMITLQESEEVVVEKDLTKEQEQTIYETEGSNAVPYVAKTIFPKVEGVVVVAQGAGTGKNTQNIIEIVQALFDIAVHKIKVAAG